MFVVWSRRCKWWSITAHSGWWPEAGGGKQRLALSLQREMRNAWDTQIRRNNDPQTFSVGKIIIILTFIGQSLESEFLQLYVYGILVNVFSKLKQNKTYLLLIMFSTWRQLNNQHWHDNMFDLIIDWSKCKVMAEKLGIMTDSINLQRHKHNILNICLQLSRIYH